MSRCHAVPEADLGMSLRFYIRWAIAESHAQHLSSGESRQLLDLAHEAEKFLGQLERQLEQDSQRNL
ncbi:hypothetical protein [Pantanalinema sp. GBBB05]|uniref:hypothetical protein n=1 Tax=Pantanalinema sp. GBBB05 TaxID=2604139 RepID=UPI001D91B023|nr:hypothetical protein [Pantanalinema sp. GBBB05]